MSGDLRSRAWVAHFYERPSVAKAAMERLGEIDGWKPLEARGSDVQSQTLGVFLRDGFLHGDPRRNRDPYAQVFTFSFGNGVDLRLGDEVTGPCEVTCRRLSIVRFGTEKPEVALVLHLEDPSGRPVTADTPLVVGAHALARPWSPMHRQVTFTLPAPPSEPRSGTSMDAIDLLCEQARLPSNLRLGTLDAPQVEEQPHVLLVGLRDRDVPAAEIDGLSISPLDRDLVTLTVDPMVSGRYSDRNVRERVERGSVDIYGNWRGLATNGSFTILVDPDGGPFVADEEGVLPLHVRSVYWLVVIDALADVVSVERYLRRPVDRISPRGAVQDHASFNRMRTEWDLQQIRSYPLQLAMRRAIRSSFDLETRIAQADQVAQARLSAATAVSTHQTEVLLKVLGVLSALGVGLGAAALWAPAFSSPAPWEAILTTTVVSIALVITVLWLRASRHEIQDEEP